MTPGQVIRNGTNKLIPTSPLELIAHAVIVITVVVCATYLGSHKDLNSGDLLAVFTAAITGTAAVAASRAGNRQFRSSDTDNQ